MKLEYRNLSSSGTVRGKRPRGFALGFLDFFAASLLIFVVSVYLILPHKVERSVDLVVYESANNSYASIRCLRERNTQYQFTQSRDLLELKHSVRIVNHADLGRYGRPRPDPVCFAARGFVEEVSRFEYFFGWLARAIG